MKVKIVKNILGDNNKIAAENRAFFAAQDILCLNIMSGPGSGKTTILEKTVPLLKETYGIRTAVIEGDIEGDDDGARLDRLGVPVVQLNTRGACHLSAPMVKSGFDTLGLAPSELDLVIVENVGNLVCPAGFDLGEDFRATVLSIPEGDDKPSKYPGMFQKSQVLLINKLDLAPHLEFSRERVHTVCKRLNPDIQIFEVSARTGEGIDQWCELVAGKVKDKKARQG